MEEEEGGGAGGRKRKRDGEDVGGEVVGVDGDAGEEGEYGGIAEESVEEVMRWLEEAIAAPAAEGAPGFVTINGNEESCGPSFSAPASTVMASVDTRAGAPPPPPVPWPWPPAGAAEEEEAAGAAGLELELELELIGDGEWLAELLASAPALEQQ